MTADEERTGCDADHIIISVRGRYHGNVTQPSPHSTIFRYFARECSSNPVNFNQTNSAVVLLLKSPTPSNNGQFHTAKKQDGKREIKRKKVKEGQH